LKTSLKIFRIVIFNIVIFSFFFEVLVRIFFSYYNRLKYKQGRRREKERKTFPALIQEMGAKDSKWWSLTLSFIVETWGIHMVRDNRSGWLRWLLKQGGVILTKHTLNHTQILPKSQ
jgi:hypothetical protein